MSELAIGGVEPFTTVDFPGRLAAVVFCQGCPWRCPYCHNPGLQEIRPGVVAWSEVLEFLEQRRGFLDGVVFSGGEPTVQSALPDAIAEVRTMGYAAGLHTAGLHPRALERVLPLLEWVGFDVKAPLDTTYDALVGRPGACQRVRESLGVLQRSGVEFTLRTTLDRNWIDPATQDRIVCDLSARGLPSPVWQICRPVERLAK